MTHLESKNDSLVLFTCALTLGEFNVETGEINFITEVSESQAKMGGDFLGTVIDGKDQYMFGNYETVALYSSVEEDLKLKSPQLKV